MNEEGEKRLKDPIYGYISVPLVYMRNIVDTPVFQRLRRIMQTSYSPLYSSAVHNRFVHSLGVYHLGRIAGKQLSQEICQFMNTSEVQEKTERFQQVFELQTNYTRRL